jgi:hypothetical protein
VIANTRLARTIARTAHPAPMPALAPVLSPDAFVDSAAGVTEATGGTPPASSMPGVGETLVVAVGLDVADLTRLLDTAAESTCR